MSVLETLSNQVAENAAAARPLQVCIGVYWSLVLVEIDGKCRAGISSTLHGGTDEHHHGKRSPVADAGHLTERSVTELVALTQSDSLLEASVGFATLNALLDVPLDRCREVNAEELIVEQGAGKKVAIIGHFPFTPHVREVASETWVLELSPREGDLPAERASDLLPRADVIGLTGTSLLNHTFDDLITCCAPNAYTLILGGTTPLSTAFFDYGIDAVAGTRIVDPEAAARSISQGATFKQIQGKQLLMLVR